ncbi:MAG: TIGR03435 family protein [Terracidiphilus sp.]
MRDIGQLAERFELTVHREQCEMPVYALTVAKDGPKITKNTSDVNGLPGESGGDSSGQSTRRFTNTSMPNFALMMLFFLDRPIVDQTGLQGRYDFS